MNLQFPIKYDGRFYLQFYWFSHGLLLLRSANHGSKRVDILFQDVYWISLPACLHGFLLERCSTIDSMPGRHALSDAEERGICQYQITSADGVYYVVASRTMSLHEDDLGPFDDSALLPDFDLKSIVDLDKPIVHQSEL